ncbi:MAG: hypothetical protein EBR82_44940 [Caulobacteraceae bacterium]|nr:hypothetical protein [Caulobacteraceae bacterium]
MLKCDFILGLVKIISTGRLSQIMFQLIMIQRKVCSYYTDVLLRINVVRPNVCLLHRSVMYVAISAALTILPFPMTL